MLPLPNSFQVPNALVDEWFDKITPSELKVLIYICRRTHGFNKLADNIALSQLEHGIYSATQDRWLDRGTGLKRSTIKRALSSLEAHGLILRVHQRDPRNPAKHLPNRYRAFPPEAEVQPSDGPGVGPSADQIEGPPRDPGVGPAVDPTKPSDTKPSETQTDRACLPDSSSTEEPGDRLLRAILRSTPRFRASTRRGQAWERAARESGLGLDTLLRVIELHGQELAENCNTPVLLIGKARELYDSGRSGISAPSTPTADAVRVAETQARNGMDEGRERLERYAKCGDGEIARLARGALQRVSPQALSGSAVAA